MDKENEQMATKTELILAERFETAFNRIHKVLKNIVKHANTDKFTELVYKGKSHILIRYYEKDLCQYAKLRNALVHEKINSDYYIAEPHQDIVEHIERIADEFEKPKTGLSISSKEVYYFYEEDLLKDVLACIKKKSHSRFPIYNEKEQYKWLLTTKEMIIWLASQFDNRNIDLNHVKVKDLYHPNYVNRVHFVSQNATVFEIEDLFEEDQIHKNRLEAILITPSGKDTEKPNGIITSTDLLEEELAE